MKKSKRRNAKHGAQRPPGFFMVNMARRQQGEVRAVCQCLGFPVRSFIQWAILGQLMEAARLLGMKYWEVPNLTHEMRAATARAQLLLRQTIWSAPGEQRPASPLDYTPLPWLAAGAKATARLGAIGN